MKIKCDSRKVKPGDTFVAIKYANDGHKYIEDAIRNGAKEIVANYGLYSVDTLIVNDTHEYLVNYLKDNYYNEIKDLKLIGITGTNGKTTIAFLIHQMLNKLNVKCGYIGTIGFYIDDKINDLNNTTPDILDIYEMLIQCKENHCEYVAIEASSHALDQSRLKGLIFEYGVFTNLTRDHLDYHLTMDNYYKSKQKLFEMVNGKCIINIDDKYSKYFLLDKNTNITYGFDNSDYCISDYNKNTFKVNGMEYKTKLMGKYNIYNIVVCLIILKELSLDENIIELLEPPIGRMETINYNNNLIIIDYAHTPDAVEKVLKSVNDLNYDNIYTIIGCGGNRDKTKRSIMGEVALKNSNYVIFTNDNPRDEDPKQIINDIIKDTNLINYEIIEDREKAIIKGIQRLNKSDILMVLGKGHETYQIIDNIKYNFSDKDVILKYIGG